MATAETHNTADAQTDLTEEQIDEILDTMADGFRHWVRAPILHRPDEAAPTTRP